MKVVVTCDQLLQRRYATSVVEAVLSLFEDADIYTLAHDPRGVLGPTALRKVNSSFLSSVIKDNEDKVEAWWSKSFLFPSASKKLIIPCSVDLIINISSGLSHAFEKCSGVYQITYVLEDALEERRPASFFEKIFKSYLLSWSKKKMMNANCVWYPYDSSDSKALMPFIKGEDFPLFPEAQHKLFPHDFLTIDAESLSLKQAMSLCATLDRDGLKYRFIGNDQHLQKIKKGDDDKRFFGERCSGELAPLMAASRAHLSWKSSLFPSKALQSLSCGMPVIVANHSPNHHFFKDELVKKINNFSDIASIWSELCLVDRNECHVYAKRFHEIKFKAEVKRRVDKIKNEILNTVKETC